VAGLDGVDRQRRLDDGLLPDVRALAGVRGDAGVLEDLGGLGELGRVDDVWPKSNVGLRTAERPRTERSVLTCSASCAPVTVANVRNWSLEKALLLMACS